MKKKFENPIVGLSTHHKKKLACEIWYESINNFGEHTTFSRKDDSKKNDEKK